MARDYKREAEHEDAQRKALRAWIQLRIAGLHDRVSAYDVLRRYGVALRQSGDGREEQFSCPFHGRDQKPSAKVYPKSERSPSHAWCFVCQERWDSVELFRKFTDPTVPFLRTLAHMEHEFGITTPEPPRDVSFSTGEVPQARVDLDRQFDLCEHRLKLAKGQFDAKGYLILGSVLDRLWTGLNKGGVSDAKARETLRKVLDKINEKVRCPVE